MEIEDDMDYPTENGDQTNRLASDEGNQGTMESSQPSSEGDDSPFPSSASIAAAVHKHQQAAGRAGGLSRSSAKREATRRNIAKARLSRWPGREQAARASNNDGINSSGEEQLSQLVQGAISGREGEIDEQAQVSQTNPNVSRNGDNSD